MPLTQIDDIARTIAPIMAAFSAPWCVAGGWAIDLFIGRTARSHPDVELAVFRNDQAVLRNHFPSWSFQKIVNGQPEIWNESEHLCTSVHEIHASSSDSLLRLRSNFC
jgi:hypothetical protein